MAPRTSFLKESKKYDVPLFCGGWAGDNYVLLGGGGGDSRHGIKNRLLVAKFSSENGELSETVHHLSTGDTPPFKLAVHPGGDIAVAAFEKGCRLFELHLEEEDKLVPSSRTLKALEDADELKFLLFSQDGTHLAAGGEDKSLRVFLWPTMEEKLYVKDAHKKGLKDADFSLDGTLLATTADSGPCHIWDVTKDKAVATLEAPQRGSLGLCRFARDGRPFLFTTAVRGGCGWVIVWDTRDWKQLGSKKFHEDPISAFAISKNGESLAMGTAGGDIAIINVGKMTITQRVKNAHLVFVTAVEFSPSSRAMLSASGDSSARVTQVTTPSPGLKEWHVYLILIILFIASAILAVFVYHNSDSFWNFPLIHDLVSKTPPPSSTSASSPGSNPSDTDMIVM